MLDRSSTGSVAVVLVAALMMTMGCVQAFDDANYPNWKAR